MEELTTVIFRHISFETFIPFIHVFFLPFFSFSLNSFHQLAIIEYYQVPSAVYSILGIRNIVGSKTADTLWEKNNK